MFDGADAPVVIRPRRQSAPWVGPPEVPNPNWDQMGGGSRPMSPAVAAAAALLQQTKGNSKHGSLESNFDEAVLLKSSAAPGEAYIVEV